MSNTVFAIGIDTTDAEKIATFWAEALGRPLAPGASTSFASLDQDSNGPRLNFHQVPEPKTVKNRLHLDLITDAFDTETERLLTLGATRVRDFTDGGRWTTFADPDGNEFDLIAG